MDALGEIVKNFNEGTEKETKLATEYQAENQKLLDEIAGLKTQTEQTDINNRVLSAISSGHKTHNVDSVMRDFMSEFRIEVDKGSEIVYNIGKDIPLLKENRPATITEVLAEWAKVEKNKHQFIAPVDSHVDTMGQPITKEDTDMLKNPAIVSAIKMTGQWRKYMKGEKINMKAVTEMVGKNNTFPIVS